MRDERGERREEKIKRKGKIKEGKGKRKLEIREKFKARRFSF